MKISCESLLCAGALLLGAPQIAAASEPAPIGPSTEASSDTSTDASTRARNGIAAADAVDLWTDCWSAQLSLTNAMTCMLLNIEADQAPIEARVNGQDDLEREEKIATAKTTIGCFSQCRDENLSRTNEATCRLQCTASLRSRTTIPDRLDEIRVALGETDLGDEGRRVAVATSPPSERR